MPRFFVDSEKIDNDLLSISIEGDDARHIGRVLRMKAGDEVEVIDSSSKLYKCSISACSNREIKLTIIGSERYAIEPGVNVTLFQGIPKGDKFDGIIRQCVELGINEIIPICTERVVVRLNDLADATKKKATRWNKIALSSAKQCGRGIIPAVLSVLSFEEAVGYKEFDYMFIPYEGECSFTLKEALVQAKRCEDIAFFVGPEGGFSGKEIDIAVKNGIIPVTLGKRILRTETCGPAVLSAIMYEFDQMK